MRKVVGPGSPAVTVAQLLAAEHGVATNMLQGPSESLILADDSADADLLAVDLLTEAEHGSDSAATLVTWSEALAAAVAAAVEPRLAALPASRSATTPRRRSSDLGGILVCRDEAEACAFANEYAVEHLQIATADPDATLERIDYAAEILIGQHTPMAAANFTIGVPNTLPSGGYAAVSSGVTARTFLATSSTAAAERRRARVGRAGRARDRRVRGLPRTRAGAAGARPVSARGTIALMPTCLVDLVRPEAGVSAVRVLRRAGYRVTFPEGQTCCGQPAWNSGFPDDAKRVAATTLGALADSEGPIVVLSGSCAATMLHAWPELFDGDARLAGVLERVVEFGALLAPLANTAPTVGARRPVAFHCSCHQRRGLRDTTSGATLISSLPNVELVEQVDADSCCGFGGTFAIKFPGVSTRDGPRQGRPRARGGCGRARLGRPRLPHAPRRRGRREPGRARDDDAARAARARGLDAMTIVYGGDKELDGRLDKALGDTRLTVTLQGSRRHLLGFREAVEERHPDWPERVDRARAIRTDAVARAPELLDRFEQAITSRGGRVVRAATADDAVRAVLEIARRRGVQVVAKGKSMISEELELNHALEAAGPDARRDRSRRVDRPARRRASLAPARARDPPLARRRSPRCSRPTAAGRCRTTRRAWSRTRATACARRSSRPAWASRAPTSWSPRAAP